MKVYLYTIDDCPFCIKMKQVLKHLPNEFQKPIDINYKDLSTDVRKKYDIKIFPTIIFLSNENKVLKKLVGFSELDDIIQAYSEVNKLTEILDRGI